MKSHGSNKHCEIVASPVSLALSDETMSISDTHLGIEVSLDLGSASAPQPPPVSYEDYLAASKKVYQSQFSTNYAAISKSSHKKTENVGIQATSTHRVSLCGIGPANDDVTFEDMAFLLQSHMVKDELTSLYEEIKKLDWEVEKIDVERMEMEQSLLGIRIPKKTTTETSWDIDLLLKEQKQQSLTTEEVAELQRKRGRCWTIQIQNPKSREALCSQLGNVVPGDGGGRRTRTNSSSSSSSSPRLVLTPANCRECHNLRQLTVQAPVSENIAASVFVTRDNGKAWGHVPGRLFKRLRTEEMNLENIEYLSTGPGGAYFCELSSGHTWWGSSDVEFVRLAKEWKVARVAFGATRQFGAETCHSWIVVARDGRVAWKNIPARLHNKLELRLADNAAPAELTLGPEDSYFVRFLDGSVDYCLPATISNVCESIERDGGRITNVVLRSDSSHDFVIRHSEVMRR
jgi:IS5 family transposase